MKSLATYLAYFTIVLVVTAIQNKSGNLKMLKFMLFQDKARHTHSQIGNSPEPVAWLHDHNWRGKMRNWQLGTPVLGKI